jgi:hypothetical protein
MCFDPLVKKLKKGELAKLPTICFYPKFYDDLTVLALCG